EHRRVDRLPLRLGGAAHGQRGDAAPARDHARAPRGARPGPGAGLTVRCAREATAPMLIADTPSGAPAAEAVMARAASENFPVASRVLPRRVRAHLLAVYGFARLVDELGDADAGGGTQERLAALDWLEQELERAFRGEAEHPLLVEVAATVRECGLAREPFAR